MNDKELGEAMRGDFDAVVAEVRRLRDRERSLEDLLAHELGGRIDEARIRDHLNGLVQRVIGLEDERDAARARVAALRKDLLVYGEHCMRAGYGIGVTHSPGHIGLPFPDSEFKRRVATICSTPLSAVDEAPSAPVLSFTMPEAQPSQREQTAATILAALIHERADGQMPSAMMGLVAETVALTDALRAALAKGGGE